MSTATIGYEELKERTGYQRRGDVERCLKDQGIRFFIGRAGVWTTVDLVNAAGGLQAQAPANSEAYSADLI